MSTNNSNKPKLRFKGFSDDWEQRKLSNIADIVGGGTPSTSNPDYWDGDIDWYAPAEIGEQIFAIGSVRKITKDGLNHSSAKILPAYKTVLFTSRAGIGNMAILQRSAATNQGFQSLVCHDDIDPYFVFSMGDCIKTKAERVAAGSTFVEISGKKLGNLEFMFPNTDEQKAIGDYFRNLDHLITLHQRKCDNLKIIKKSMLDNLFPKNGEKVPKWRFKGFNNDWEQRKLGDECNQLTTVINPQNEPNRLFAEYSMPAYDLNKNPDYVLGSTMNSARKVVDRPCLLINKLNVRKQRIWCIEDPEKNAVCSAEFIPVCSEGIDLRFLSYVVSGNAFTSYLEDCSSGSSNSQKRVTPDTIMNAEICIPSRAEQQKIGAYFKDLDHLITLHQSEVERLKKAKQFFLDKMFI